MNFVSGQTVTGIVIKSFSGILQVLKFEASLLQSFTPITESGLRLKSYKIRTAITVISLLQYLYIYTFI